MKKSRFTDSQILAILKQAENGIPVTELCRQPVRLEAQTAANMYWSVDFMSDALRRGQRFRTFNVLDDFSREILAIEIDINLPSAWVIRVLERIAAWRGYPAKLRMENGPEFVSVQLAGWAQQHGVELEFIQPGKPTLNSYVERFNRSFRDEVLNFYVFNRLSEVRDIVDRWAIENNEQKPRESLGNLTPEEFALKHTGKSSLALYEERDVYNMTEAELIFTALAELSTRQIAESMNGTGMKENAEAGKRGGGIAKQARQQLEEKTGQKVVTGANNVPSLPGKKK